MIPRTQNGARRALCVGAAILITWLAGPAASAGTRYLGSASHTARFCGAPGSPALQQPVVGMAATPSGGGYWLVAADGGIFTFGNARFRGAATTRATAPIVGMAATPSGKGYWIVSDDGGTAAFGDGRGFGTQLAGDGAAIVAIAASPRSGYWVAARDGTVGTSVTGIASPTSGSTGARAIA